VPCPSLLHRDPHQQTARLVHRPAARRPAARQLRCVACHEGDGEALDPSAAGSILETAQPGRPGCPLPSPLATAAAGVSFPVPVDECLTRRHPGGDGTSLATWTASGIALPSMSGLGSRSGSGGAGGAGGSVGDGLRPSPSRQRRAERRHQRVRGIASAAPLLRGSGRRHVASGRAWCPLLSGGVRSPNAYPKSEPFRSCTWACKLL